VQGGPPAAIVPSLPNRDCRGKVITVWIPFFAKCGNSNKIDSRGPMTPDQTRALYIIAGIVAFAFLWRRREAFAYLVRRVLIASCCAALTYVLLWKGGLPPAGAYIAALVVGVLVRLAEPRRSRHISARAKRQAIAKFEKETGQAFNRRIHEFDHILAHSRGGGNAEENIQVLPRKKNRSKGAKVRWRDRDEE
jgi:hypothetical protein